MKKYFSLALIIFLFVGFFSFAFNVSAESEIVSATLNGTSQWTTESGSQVTAIINVKLTEFSSWRSTAYQIGNEPWVCVDTPDHFGNITTSEIFPIIVSQKAGSVNVNFQIFENNNCTNGIESAIASADLSSAFMNAFSIIIQWQFLLFLALIIFLIFIIFYIVKKNIKKK
jgi:hypothetical protein